MKETTGDSTDTDMKTTQHSGSNKTSESSKSNESGGFSSNWSSAILRMHAPILKCLQGITRTSARNPKSMVAGVVTFSVGIFVLGILTNFNVDVDEDVIWIPRNSSPLRHQLWIKDESGFPTAPKSIVMILHGDGRDDILGRDEVLRVFQAVKTVQNLPNYDEICAPYGCNVTSVTHFWDNNMTLFEETTTTDDDVIAAISAESYPDGSPVSDRDLFGTPRRDDDGILVSAKSYTVSITLPEDQEETKDASLEFEEEALETILDLAEDWETTSLLQLEVISDRSFSDEFGRSIVKDLPLLPLVFVIMGVFTSAIFFKKDKVRSRSLLGFTAVVSVLLSILGGYGLMFVCGVPFTSMTQILPFVFFGVGLDDSFIITGSYMRLDHIRDPVERIRMTIDDIGMSIFLTTLTSSLAFALGCLSSVPAILWLCVYAVPTIIAILLVQLTFFISCVVLDERRIQANNRDCWRCLSCRKPDAEGNEIDGTKTDTTSDRFMKWYAEKLLQPVVQGLVIVVFVALAVICAISMTHLKQAFEFTDVLPGDSYIVPFLDAFDDYSERSSVVAQAFFRKVDQSDPLIQDQMEAYIKELATIDAIESEPEFFWLRDFKQFVNTTDLAALTFTEQLDIFLDDPVYNDFYSDNILRDEQGNIVVSRCTVFMDNVDIEDVNNQIDALKDQRAITESQPINEDKEDLRFFLYGGDYGIWEFYARSASEIVATTVWSMAAVTVVTFIFVPHWSAALFVLPLICVLYVDLLGVMQWAGVSINPISYIALVMSIGLLVDFILHVLFRYYEVSGSRREKVVKMLETMGSSILIGGITTFLGTVPLALSTNGIFSTIFVAFVGLVTMGGAHGLILLPVVLSLVGPEDASEAKDADQIIENDDNDENDGMVGVSLYDSDDATA